MASVQPVSQKNEYKKHYIKPTGLMASTALGATYGLTRGKLANNPLEKVLYPLDYKLETFLSKAPLGKKFVDFMQKTKAEIPDDLLKLYKKSKEIDGVETVIKEYRLDKSLAAKSAILLAGVYVTAKLIKKGIDYVLYDRYRK